MARRSHDSAWSTSSSAYGAFAATAEKTAAAIKSGGPIRLERMPSPTSKGRDEGTVSQASINIDGVAVGILKYQVFVSDCQVYPQPLPPHLSSVDQRSLITAVMEYFKRSEGNYVVMWESFDPQKGARTT